MPPKTRKRKAAEISKSKPEATTSGQDKRNEVKSTDGEHPITGSDTDSKPASFTIATENEKDISCELWLTDQDPDTRDIPTTLIFTHGAGGGLETPAMQLFAAECSKKTPVVCFQGNMNLKARTKSFQHVLDHMAIEQPKHRYAVGGRSMGARAAVMVSQDNDAVKLLVLASYPLTSPKGDKRDEILLALPEDKEVLFIIGSSDNMCDIGELQDVRKKMKASSRLIIVDHADHGMSLTKVPKGQTKAALSEHVRRVTGRDVAIWLHNPENFKDTQHMSTGIDYDDKGHS